MKRKWSASVLMVMAIFLIVGLGSPVVTKAIADTGCTDGDCPPQDQCTNGDCPPDPTCTDGGCPLGEDKDGDEYDAQHDCNDNDASIHPYTQELCDGKDNDCDGDLLTGEVDNDGDGYLACNECDDTDAEINPNAVELPGNSIDENCDGSLGACDPTAAWKNHGQFVRCVAHEADALIAAGTLTQEEGDALIGSAAQSDVGK